MPYWKEHKICVVEWKEYDAGFNLFYPKDPVDSEVLVDRKASDEISIFQVWNISAKSSATSTRTRTSKSKRTAFAPPIETPAAQNVLAP